MWAPAIIKAEMPADPSSGLRHAFVGVQIDLLIFDRPPEPLDKDIVPPCAATVHGDVDLGFFSTAVKSMEVNCDPWSVLKMPGLPCRASASSSASIQKAVSIVIDSRQDRTRRLNQSTTAQR